MILNYPNNITTDQELNPGWIEFAIYERKSPQSSTPHGYINLYLPEKMNNPNTVSWGNIDAGYMGNLLQGGGSFGEASKRFLGNFATGAANVALKSGGSSISADDARAILTGQVKNPYLTAMFKGVDFRTFSMDFKFHPRSEKDCSTIDSIIREFRAASLPPGRAADRSAFLGYPREIEIRYIWRGQDNPFLHKFKRCAIAGIQTDYTGMGSWTVMRNGFPAEIFLSLTFTELEIILRDDVLQGHY